MISALEGVEIRSARNRAKAESLAQDSRSRLRDPRPSACREAPARQPRARGARGRDATPTPSRSRASRVVSPRPSGQAALQRIEGKPSLLLDAAHNVMAAEALARYLESASAREARAAVRGHEGQESVGDARAAPSPREPFHRHPARNVPRPRSREARALREGARGPGGGGALPRAALARAREIAGPEGEVLVAGSIFLLGEVLPAL